MPRAPLSSCAPFSVILSAAKNLPAAAHNHAPTPYRAPLFAILSALFVILSALFVILSPLFCHSERSEESPTRHTTTTPRTHHPRPFGFAQGDSAHPHAIPSPPFAVLRAPPPCHPERPSCHSEAQPPCHSEPPFCHSERSEESPGRHTTTTPHSHHPRPFDFAQGDRTVRPSVT